MNINIKIAILSVLFVSVVGNRTCKSNIRQGNTLDNTLEVPVLLPKGGVSVTYDIGHNYWCLVPVEPDGLLTLMVLPAGAKSWLKERLSGIEKSDWHTILADEHGFLWIADSKRLLVLDPRFPSKGWTDCASNEKFPDSQIVKVILGAKGNPLAALNNGCIVDADVVSSKEKENLIPSILIIKTSLESLTDVELDDNGTLICSNGSKNYKIENRTAWQRHWKMVARMPGSNHDLRGDVLNGKFYMAGGFTAEYGYPLASHAYSELFEFDPISSQWKVVADLGLQRIYCASAPLGNEIWVVGGDVLEKNGNRYTTNLAQKVNPTTGEVIESVKINHLLPAPVSFNAGGRLYVIGYESYTDESRLLIESIGENETKWRSEENGPKGKGALYGCKIDDKYYVVVANKYVACFNPQTEKWSTIDIPNKVRSPQVSHFNGELWIMGGRDQDNQVAVQIYNFEKKQWRKGPELPRELAWGVAFNVNGNLYVTGGAAGRCYNNRTFCLKKSDL